MQQKGQAQKLMGHDLDPSPACMGIQKSCSASLTVNVYAYGSASSGVHAGVDVSWYRVVYSYNINN